ncbi:MAG: hypothetical protein KTR30_21670 [Saprospiraceae bacterium]|nr:hypothetical protein [Saprospiraceae bacterium]
MLTTRVKASSITNLTDARYFAAWEVEWLGFNLNLGSADYIEPHLVKAIKEWVDGVKIIGEFDLSSADHINEMVQALGLDGAQLGMFTAIETFQDLEYATTLFKEIVVEKETTETSIREHMTDFAPYVKAFVLNFEKNHITLPDLGAGAKLNKEELILLCKSFPVLINMPIDAVELADLMGELSPLGLSVKGGAEEKVGYKSFDELDELFELLEVES